jgi:hypothetical protein
MEGIRGVPGYRRVLLDFSGQDSDMVYLHFIPYHGFAPDYLLYSGLLDEHKKLYPELQEKPFQI